MVEINPTQCASRRLQNFSSPRGGRNAPPTHRLTSGPCVFPQHRSHLPLTPFPENRGVPCTCALPPLPPFRLDSPASFGAYSRPPWLTGELFEEEASPLLTCKRPFLSVVRLRAGCEQNFFRRWSDPIRDWPGVCVCEAENCIKAVFRSFYFQPGGYWPLSLLRA